MSHAGCGMFRQLISARLLDVHIPNILMGIASSVEDPLIPLVGRDLGLSKSTIANVVTAGTTARMLQDIPTGAMAEVLGEGHVMVAMLAVHAAICVVGIFSVAEPVLWVYAILGDLSYGAFLLSRHMYASGTTTAAHRGTLMSLIGGLPRWAHVLGAAASGVVFGYFPLRAAFLIPMAATLLSVMSLLFSTGVRRGMASRSRSHSSTAGSDTISNENVTELSEKVHEPPSSSVESDRNRNTVSTPTVVTPAALQLANESSGSRGPSASWPPSHSIASEEFRTISNRSYGTTMTSHTHPSSCVLGHLLSDSEVAISLDGDDGGLDERFTHAEGSTLQLACEAFTESWGTTWRLGVFIVLFMALRSTRKLILSLATLELALADSDLSFLVSCAFFFDAVLFPIGGILLDLWGRRAAMVTASLGLAGAYLFVPFATTREKLFVAAGLIGTADALCCGLVLTVIADNAPRKLAGPFFGIMRTIQDLGHVLGAGLISLLMKYQNFTVCCFVFVGLGVFVALWALLGFAERPRQTPTPKRTTGSPRSDDDAAEKRHLLSVPHAR